MISNNFKNPLEELYLILLPERHIPIILDVRQSIQLSTPRNHRNFTVRIFSLFANYDRRNSIRINPNYFDRALPPTIFSRVQLSKLEGLSNNYWPITRFDDVAFTFHTVQTVVAQPYNFIRAPEKAASSDAVHGFLGIDICVRVSNPFISNRPGLLRSQDLRNKVKKLNESP